MKKFQLLIWVVTLTGTIGFGQIDRTGTRTDVEVLKKSKASKKINRLPFNSTCGDLSANSIEYRLVRKSTSRTGTVKIIATVKNITKYPFSIKEGRVKVKLIEVTRSGKRIVKGVKLRRLNGGKQIQLEFNKRWFARSRSSKRPIYYSLEIEYPSTKSLQLTHNDCRMTNNIGRRTTTDIDELFSVRK